MTDTESVPSMSKMIPSYLHAIVPAVNVGEVCVVGRGGVRDRERAKR